MSTGEESSPEEPSGGFGDLGLDDRLLEQLEVMGFEQPTPIQSEAMPHLLEGRDVADRCIHTCREQISQRDSSLDRAEMAVRRVKG